MAAVLRVVRGAAAVVLAATAVVVPATAATASVTPPPPLCEQTLPAATEGSLVLDTPTVQAGTSVLGVLTGVATWPARLVGGGSGETFLSCTPWTPSGAAEVMPGLAYGFFLVDVPAGTPPGDYPVSLVYAEGSQLPAGGDGTLVRLSTTVTVVSGPVARPSTGAACALTGEPDTVWTLAAAGDVAPGGVARFTLSGPEYGPGMLNEYDGLRLVACIDGGAVPVVAEPYVMPVDLAVPIPAGLAPGTYTVRMWGSTSLDGGFVWWEAPLTVVAPAGPELAATGTSAVTTGVVAGALVLAGLAALLVGRARSRASRTHRERAHGRR